MTVSFKQFATFIKKTEGELTQAQIDEAWADVFRRKKEEAEKDEDKDKPKVLTAKERLEKAAEDKKKKEEDRKKELQKKRDEAWLAAKERAEGKKKPAGSGRGSDRDDYAMHRGIREAKESYSDEGYWKDDAKERGFKIKKLSGDLMSGNQTWGAFDGDKKMGEFTEEEDGRGGWLIKEAVDRDAQAAEQEEGFKFAKYMRGKNKEASPAEIAKMSPAYKRGYMKGLNEAKLR